MTEKKTTLIEELGRRQVLKAAGIYAGGAWLATEITLAVIDQLPLDANLRQIIRVGLVAVFAASFPLVMLLAWYWDWFRGGIRREQQWQDASPASRLMAVGLLLVSTGALLLAMLWIAGIGRTAKSLAVYPCDFPGGPGGAFHATAVARDIHYQLSSLHVYRVVPWSESSLGTAAADYLLDCRLRLDERLAQLSVRVFDAGKNSDIWTTEIAADADSVFLLPDRAIVAMSEELIPANSAVLINRWAGQQTPITEAWNSYARALPIVDSTRADELGQALEFMQAATEHDNRYARAYVWIARLHWRLAQLGEQSAESSADAEWRARLSAADSNVQRALIIQPDLGDALDLQQRLARYREDTRYK